MATLFFDNLCYQMGVGEGHLIFRFDACPRIDPTPFALDSGATLHDGDTIHGLFGPKTSAGYENFHPIAPGHLIYRGIYSDLRGDILLCDRHDRPQDFRSENGYFYWGWMNTGGNELFTLSSGGAGRVLQTDFSFLNGQLPPKEAIGNDQFWKQLNAGFKSPRL